MSSGVKGFLIGAAAVGASFLIPGSGAFILAGKAALFNYGASRLSALAARHFLSEKAEGVKQNITSTQANLPVVYGVARVGLKIVDTRVIDAQNVTTPSADPSAIFTDLEETSRKVLLRVGALCLASENGGGIEGVDSIRFYRSPTDSISGPDLDGALGNTGVVENFEDHVKYLLLDGDDAQAVPSELTDHAGWSTSAKGVGVAYAAFFLKYDADVWRGGIPEITAQVTGQKVYDPRSDSWAWSDNPALCLLDYLTSKRYGAGLFYPERDGGDTSLSAIDEQSFIDAANYCDEVVAVGYGPSQKRFTMNGVVDTGKVPAQNIADMASSCRGELIWQGGKYRLVIRQATTPETLELTEDNIVGEWNWTRRGASVPNIIEATFVDERNGDFVAESLVWPLTGDTAFIDADNGVENRMEIDLPFVTDYYRALQIAMVLLRELRQDVIVEVTVKGSALELEAGTVVNVTHETPGWTAKPFWITTVVMLPDGNLRLGLLEYDADSYALDSLAARATVPGTDLPNAFICQPPENLTLTSDSSTALLTQDGQRIPQILADWDASPDPFLSHYEIWWKLAAETDYQSAPVPKLNTSATITPVTDAEDYDVVVVAVNILGVRSLIDAAGAFDSVTVGTLPGDDVRNALDNFREIERDETGVTLAWDRGASVDTVWVYINLVEQPVEGDPWPGSDPLDLTTDLVAVLPIGTDQYTIPSPPPGWVKYCQFEPLDEDGIEGPHRRVLVLPLAEEPDVVFNFVATVNDLDGSVLLRGDVGNLCGSVRYAFSTSGTPSDAAVEAGAILTPSNGSVSTTLPAGTVGLGETIIVRAAGYTNANGTGYLSDVTAHGTIVSAEDTRTKLRAPTWDLAQSEPSTFVGRVVATLSDPDGIATGVEYRVRTGGAGWGAWQAASSGDPWGNPDTPSDGADYTFEVTLHEKRASNIQVRAAYQLSTSPAKTAYATASSDGFDPGQFPHGDVTALIDEDNLKVRASAGGDIDTDNWRLAASKVSAAAAIARLDVGGAYIAIAARNVNSDNAALAGGIPLETTLVLGDDVWVAGRPYGPNGEVGDDKVDGAVFRHIAPTLKITTEEEDENNGTSGVTVDDPGGQATSLEYRTKEGEAPWGEWTDAVSATPGLQPPDDATEYTQTVPLVVGHLSFVQWRLTFTLRGQTQVVGAMSAGFDKGKVPGGSVTIVLNASGEARAVAHGEFDTTGWKLGGSKVSQAAADAAAAAAGVTSGRMLDPTDMGALVTGIVYGDTVYVSGIPVAADDTEGPTARDEFYNDVAREPSFRIITESESTTLGTFRVELNDPDGLVTAMQERTKVGPAAWSDYATIAPVTGDEYEKTVALLEKHFSFVEFRATYVLEGSTLYVPFKSSGFDPGQIPNVLSVSSSFDTAGTLTVAVNCDSDSDRFFVYANKVGFADRATTKASGTEVVASKGLATFTGYAAGEEAFITVVAVNDSTSQENTEVAEHKNQFTDTAGGEQGNYVRGAVRWEKGASPGTFSALCAVEVGPDTTSLIVEYTDPSGASLLTGDSPSVTPPNAAFLVSTGSTAVVWALGAVDVVIQLTPKNAANESGAVKTFPLKSPGNAAETAVGVETQDGTQILSDRIKARDGYGAQFVAVSGRANLQVLLGDKVTISESDASGTPTDPNDVALWIKVAPL